MGLVPFHQIDEPDFAQRVAADIEAHGCAGARDAVDLATVASLRTLVDAALVEDEAWHGTERTIDEGRVTFLPRYGREPLSLLEDPVLMGPVEAILGDRCTLYTMTTLCQPPHNAGRPLHVDTQYWVPGGFIVGLGVIVALDDFTPESGTTRLYPEVTFDAPSDEAFEERALRFEAPAGSVCWFHGRAWHDVPPNTTDHWRRAVLLAMIRPWVRQRFDMARMLAHHDVTTFSPALRQKLGFDLIAPGSYEEYFLPDDTRKDELLRRAVERD